MHEVSIIMEAMRLAEESARKAGASRICLVRLRVGEMSGVVPSALQFAFEAVTDGTLAQGATLEIENSPATGWCEACQIEFAWKGLLRVECPRCQGGNTILRRGRELELASLEVE